LLQWLKLGACGYQTQTRPNTMLRNAMLREIAR
jgi:hypothetical protein